MKVGDRFGSVEVLTIQGSKIGVRCDCGAERSLTKEYLMLKKRAHCYSCEGVSRRVCRVGDRYDQLTVLQMVKEEGHLYALCQCACGNTIKVRSDVIRRSKTNHCGCQPGGNWKGYKGLSLTYFHRLKAGARQRTVLFDVTIEHLWDCLEGQRHRCALSGVPIVLSFRAVSTSTASVDRIDSTLGYVPGNVQWVHRDVNRMKLNHAQGYFIDLCHCVSDCQRGLPLETPQRVRQQNAQILAKRFPRGQRTKHAT